MSKRILLGVAAVALCAGAGICFGAPVIIVEPNELNFTAAEGGDNPDAQILYISNGGTGRLDWEITEDCAWLSVDPVSGTSFGEDNEIEISVNAAGLSIGEYSCELRITDPDASNSPQLMSVNLEVVGPILKVFKKYFEFRAFEDVANPVDQVLTIGNAGGGILNWSMQKSCDWLDANPMAGIIAAVDSENVTLSADITGLDEGIYSCELIISDPDAANSPQSVDVTLYVEKSLLVPRDFPTIQSAIDAAIEGDTIFVADGVYTGYGNRDIDFLGKAITVRSENRSESCIIDCQGSELDEHRGFIFENGETNESVLNGFTIRHGYIKDGGGGVFCYGSDPVITNCMIVDNTADYAGGVLCSNSNAEIRNCVISQNNAIGDPVAGGILCISSSNVEITGCTISANTNLWFEGAAVEISFFSSAVFRNCIVWSNICEYPLLVWPESELGVWYSDIEGGEESVSVSFGDSLTWGEGNIDVYPSFVDVDRGDYHLRWDSPCQNMGDPEFVPEEGEVDIDGEPRLMVLGVDIGADEVGFRQADFTRDGVITIKDFAVMSSSWQSEPGSEKWYVLCDLYVDSVIDPHDLEIFAIQWLWQGGCGP
jgi:hypothetical protein